LLVQLEHRVTLGEPVGSAMTLSGSRMQSNYQADPRLRHRIGP
jgi:hypothetical protein